MKTMLTSPQCDHQGFSNTLSVTDVGSLKAMGNNLEAATNAAAWVHDAEQFMAAYARIDEKVASKLLDSMET